MVCSIDGFIIELQGSKVWRRPQLEEEATGGASLRGMSVSVFFLSVSLPPRPTMTEAFA